MRKILGVLLAICTAVSLVGCSGSGGSSFTVGEFCDAYNKSLEAWSETYSIDYGSMTRLNKTNSSGTFSLIDGSKIKISTGRDSVGEDDSVQEVAFICASKMTGQSTDNAFNSELISFFESALPNATPNDRSQVMKCYVNGAGFLPELSDGKVVDCGYGSFVINYSDEKTPDYTGKYYSVEDSSNIEIELDVNSFGVGNLNVTANGNSTGPTSIRWGVSENNFKILSQSESNILSGKIDGNTITLSTGSVLEKQE